MADKFFGAIGIIGGGTGDIDSIDGSNVVEGNGVILIDVARVGGLYSLDATSALGEKSPSTIIPDANPGTKEWILTELNMAGLNLYEADSTNLFQISMSSGDTLIDNTFDTGTITFQGEDTGNKTMLVLDPAGVVAAYWKGIKTMETYASVANNQGGIKVYSDSNATSGYFIADDDNNTLSIYNVIDSGAVNLLGHDAGSTFRLLLNADPDAGVTLYYNGTAKAASIDDGFRVATGILTIPETTTPTADANEGKVYCKNDNKLYFQDGAGVEHEIAYA